MQSTIISQEQHGAKVTPNVHLKYSTILVQHFESEHQILVHVLFAHAISEGSDKPAYPRSLVRAFAARTRNVVPETKADPVKFLWPH